MMKCLNCKNISIIGACTVVIISAGIVAYLAKKKYYNPDKLLNEVKTYFMDVKGSYGQLVDYDFYADAYSGEVLNIIEL